MGKKWVILVNNIGIYPHKHFIFVLMKYELIKKYKISHKRIAKVFGYKDVKSFRTASRHKLVMNGVNEILGEVDGKKL